MKKIKILHWFLKEQIGIDFKKMLNIYRVVFFIRDYLIFSRTNTHKYDIRPCLHDKFEDSGNNLNEYFWQDLYVAQKIFKSNPLIHFDIGGRIDGFVAHLASFRIINVIDIRPLQNITNNILFHKIDISRLSKNFYSITDSLSCLHTFEHFGLGRYGDTIDNNSRNICFYNLSKMLKYNSIFYFSTPIGTSKIFFNAHKVSSFNEINDLFNTNGFIILEMAYRINHSEQIITHDFDLHINYFNNNDYTLVIFTLKKVSNFE